MDFPKIFIAYRVDSSDRQKEMLGICRGCGQHGHLWLNGKRVDSFELTGLCPGCYWDEYINSSEGKQDYYFGYDEGE